MPASMSKYNRRFSITQAEVDRMSKKMDEISAHLDEFIESIDRIQKILIDDLREGYGLSIVGFKDSKKSKCRR